MKKLLIFILSIMSINLIYAQTSTQNNRQLQYMKTNIGEIAIYQKEVPDTVPVIFLHGVYYDHNLWNYHASQITDRTVITIDMPLHGQSKQITKSDWTLNDCAEMLVEILGGLGYEQVYAVGHSWGSMTILRAAAAHPERFKAIGLCNMPFREGSIKTKLQFGFQHMLLPLRNFYTAQVAKAMFSEKSMENKLELTEYLSLAMSKLSKKDVRKTDRAVITNANDGKQFLQRLNVPALALKGNKDYVGTPENIETIIVESAHTSPIEQPEDVLSFIRRVLSL